MLDEPAQPIFGGVFGLETPEGEGRAPFHGTFTRYFLSARCALFALIQVHKPKAVWLPSYLCPALAAPFVESEIAVRYYPLDENLEAGSQRWIEKVRPGDFAVVIHYFGFPNRSFPASEVTRRGAVLIEDASQALFLEQQFPESAGIIYSPRKFLGVPDAGVLVAPEQIVMHEPAPPPEKWWERAVEVSRMRREFDSTGRPSDWFARFQRVEAEYPVGLYGASDLSRNILDRFDYAAAAERRRKNYSTLLQLAGGYAMFPELPSRIVPLGFPVRISPDIRELVLRRLHSLKVYAPVHWRIDDLVPAEFTASHTLAQSTLTLICDQRCSASNMEREAGEFLAIVAAAHELSREKRSGDRFPSRETRLPLD